MLDVYPDVVLHTNDPDLTYHPSVKTPKICPLVVDFNDNDVIGRVFLKWDESHTDLVGTLYMDQTPEFLADPVIAMCATDGTTIFESENGTHYAMEGQITMVSVLTWGAAIRLSSSQPPGPEKEGA